MNTENQLWNGYRRNPLRTACSKQGSAERGGRNAPLSKRIGFERLNAEKTP